MTVYIDADGCPVTHICERVCAGRGIRCTIVCDDAHVFFSDTAEIAVTSSGADSVDFKLCSMLKPGDIAMTQDYGLAAMCLAKGARVINQNGDMYTADNIDSLLLSRHENRILRKIGRRTGKMRKRMPEQDVRFERELNRLLDEK